MPLSPPKSGCIPWVGPMKPMYEALFGSTEAAVMLVFHQFVSGKSGNGGGSGPPTTAAKRMERRGTRAFSSIPIAGPNNLSNQGKVQCPVTPVVARAPRAARSSRILVTSFGATLLFIGAGVVALG